MGRAPLEELVLLGDPLTSRAGHRSGTHAQASPPRPALLLRPDPGYQVHSTVRSNAGAEGLILWSDHSAARPSLSPATAERSSVMRATEPGRVDRVEGGSTGAELRVVRPISRQPVSYTHLRAHETG